MLRCGPRVRVMATITLREGRGRIAQDETRQVVVRVRLPIRFNGFEENWFLLRKPFFIILSVGPVHRAFRLCGLVNLFSLQHFLILSNLTFPSPID